MKLRLKYIFPVLFFFMSLSVRPLWAAIPISVDEREHRLTEMKNKLQQALDKFKKQEEKSNFQPTLRDLPNAALSILILGKNPKEAERYLHMAFHEQYMDRSDKNYGQVPWQVGHPEIKDQNAIEFTMQAMGSILTHYGERLSPNIKEELRPHLEAAFEAIRRHKVPVSYTNIFLMKTTNLILVGEAIGDTKAADEGYALLQQWADDTAVEGIHEYDSPTYYAADLNSLVVGYLYAAKPEGKELYKKILDYFWTEMAANAFGPAATVAGPHSRDYDFLFGTGGTELYFYLEGLRDQMKIGGLDFEKSLMVEGLSSAGYHPSEQVLRWAKPSEKTIFQIWGNKPGEDRTLYMTPDFAIGSVSSDYGPQNKNITVDFLSEKQPFPVLSIIPDLQDNPYGKTKFKDASGHSKPHIWPMSPVTVQSKGTILALLNTVPTHEKKAYPSLATNIVFPTQVDQIVLNGQTVHLDSPTEILIPDEKAILGIRQGQSVVAVRIFRANGYKQKTKIGFKNRSRKGLN